MKSYLALFFPVLIAGLTSAVQGGETPKVVRTQIEYVEMPKADLTRLLMAEKPEENDATELRMKVQELVEKGEAEIIDTQLVQTKSRLKAGTDSRHELIFPTEYEPPRFYSHPDTSLPAMFRRYQGLPTAFETRNLGSMLEVETTVSENPRVVDIVIHSSFTWHTGDKVWSEVEVAGETKPDVRMPDFYVVEVKTAGAFSSGKYSLLAVVSPKDAKGDVDTDRKMMVFLKCHVLEVK